MISNKALDSGALTYHWLSYWTGCPISPAFLSLTLLITDKTEPPLLIVIELSIAASFCVWAILIWLDPEIPVPDVIAW